MKKRIFLFLLMLLLVSAGNGLSEGSLIRRAIGYLTNADPIRFEISAEIGKMPQFDTVRTEKLNRILRHFSLEGVLDPYESFVSLSTDGKALFSYTETEASGKIKRILTTDPDCPISIPDDLELSGEEGGAKGLAEGITRNASIHASLDVCRSLFSSFPEIFKDRTAESKINQKYKGYGTAVRRAAVTIPGDELNALFRDQPDLFPETGLIPDLRNVIFSGRQSFILLFAEDGQLILIQYSGKAGTSEDDLRNVRLDWKTIRDGSAEKDELQLRTPNPEGTRRNNFLLTHEWNRSEEGSESFVWKAETDDVAGRVRTRGMTEIELKAEPGTQLTGKVSVTVTVKSQTVSDEAILTASAPDRDPFTGTLEIISKKDKIETDRLRVRFSLSQDVPMQVSADRPEPEAITAEDFGGILEKLYSEILREILQLPKEDLLFLNEGIPEEEWNSILQILN